MAGRFSILYSIGRFPRSVEMITHLPVITSLRNSGISRSAPFPFAFGCYLRMVVLTIQLPGYAPASFDLA